MSSPTPSDRADPQAARSGQSATFRERMTPALWVWAAGSLLGLLAGLTFFPIARHLTVVAIVLFTGLIVATLLLFSPVVTVTADEVIAGRASIPVTLLGEATTLDAAAMRHALGPGLDVRSYICMRGWITTGVRIELNDPDDPTPYWLISSRRPEALVAAIERARAGARHTG